MKQNISPALPDAPADGSSLESLSKAVGLRAANLFLSRDYLCTEAVFTAVNESLGGDLSEDQIMALTAGFTIGIGESGCLCGAVSGGVMALGYFIGRDSPRKRRKDIRDAAARLHAEWVENNRSSCCRVLTRKIKNDKKIHFKQCADFTGQAAELTMNVILDFRPELAGRVNNDYLSRKDTFLSSRFNRFLKSIRK